MSNKHQRPVVALIFGGDSTEHGVSCLTAASVVRAIDHEQFDVVGIGITPSGRWSRLPVTEISEFAVVDGQLPVLGEDLPDALMMRTDAGTEIATRLDDRLVDNCRIDVAFALLHGTFGEDGTIQGMFEMMGVRYVGAGVTASATGMDKQVMKQVLLAAGLPVGPFVAITPRQWREDRAACLESVAALTFPVYVKPARGGSSVGITRVNDLDHVADAITEAHKYDPKVVVEQGFEGARELECGVLEDPEGGNPRASSVAEIRMHTADAFYDFQAKYLPDEQVSLDVPAQLADRDAEQVRQLAVKAFDAFACEGLARVDCFLTREGKVVINEINTMPGFTMHSMFPRMWEHAGVEYPQLIAWLINLALQRPLGLR